MTRRDGMTCHDGAPVAAADGAFTCERCMNSDCGCSHVSLAPVATVEATGDPSVRFTLTEPSAPFANITLGQIPILRSTSGRASRRPRR